VKLLAQETWACELITQEAQEIISMMKWLVQVSPFNVENIGSVRSDFFEQRWRYSNLKSWMP
jgi:hypothetical protein